MCAATIVYQKQTLFTALRASCNWEYDLISRQLTVWTDEDVSVYDEGAIQLLKDQLPAAEDGKYHLVSDDEEMQFSDAPYDKYSSSLYAFLSSFWKKKEEKQETGIHAVAC